MTKIPIYYFKLLFLFLSPSVSSLLTYFLSFLLESIKDQPEYQFHLPKPRIMFNAFMRTGHRAYIRGRPRGELFGGVFFLSILKI